MEKQDLLTPTEAAEIIGISPKTVNEYMSLRRIGYVLVNGRRRITREQVEDYVRNSAFKVIEPIKP